MLGGLSTIGFAAPWALWSLLFLPILWQFLRVMPPKPSIVRFPAVRLLQELSSDQQLATKTPWWILLLRSLIIVFLILAMARPVTDYVPAQIEKDSPLVLIVDNDWSVMDRWDTRKKELSTLLTQAKIDNRDVLLLSGTQSTPAHFRPATEAEKSLDLLRANPWPNDHATLLNTLKGTLDQLDDTAEIIWISNGLSVPDEDFAIQLHGLGDLKVITESPLPDLLALSAVKRTQTGFDVTLSRLKDKGAIETSLHILDENGLALYQQRITLDPGVTDKTISLSVPNELRARATLLRLDRTLNPAAYYLLDEKWRDRPVGILQARTTDKNLLHPAYYLRKGLAPHAPIIEGDLATLLSRKLSLIIHTGDVVLAANASGQLANWITQGGIFIRFANTTLTDTPRPALFDLLPVQLMLGERALGGTLSWKAPSKLAPFPEQSPFFGLDLPKDLSIKKQVLARPDANLAEKSWAQLEDGTPLVSARKIGNGWSVLFHVTPVPDWSNLPLSGTFELMLTRLLALSEGNSFDQRVRDLPPYRLFDHNAQLVSPYGAARPLPAETLTPPNVSAEHPPGLYGTEQNLYAFNLGPRLTNLAPLRELPHGVVVQSFSQNQQTSLAPWALLGAFILALCDWALSIARFRMVKTAAAAIAFLLLSCVHAQAEPDWDKMMAAANQMRLAYLETGDAKMDDTTRRGLDGLASVLRRRTAVELGPTMPYDPEKDDPSLFPLIYWATQPTQPALSTEASTRLNTFLSKGGFLLIDTMGSKSTPNLTRLTQGLNIPSLQQVPADHVLTRSFYLLQDYPGRYDHKDVWVETNADQSRDRVSSVLIGNNAWVQAWARDDQMRPIYPVVPGDEIQREQAYRFGINLVMYILSGNYKGDQVHLPAILQRLGL
ncbi:DUF4159 domain-containing protein [Terasakiella pusilla]|uniref:DUF4159 domain-containing protein n=1 Tax=Terasakiella pusilla TaxID=64973 RepID=UPI003AA7F84C